MIAHQKNPGGLISVTSNQKTTQINLKDPGIKTPGFFVFSSVKMGQRGPRWAL